MITDIFCKTFNSLQKNRVDTTSAIYELVRELIEIYVNFIKLTCFIPNVTQPFVMLSYLNYKIYINGLSRNL